VDVEVREGEAFDDESVSPKRTGVAGMCVAFFLAELGDKTQLTTAALAGPRAPPCLIGATLGLFGATLLAPWPVASGRRVSARTLGRIGGAFAAVGVYTLTAAVV
jgi:putative Ca2+/H+ antiporter (TMEM165/GDT1 family)